MPMFWRLFLANAVALAVAFLALAFGLVTVSVPPTSDQLFILILGFASLLLINAAMASYGLTGMSELREAIAHRSDEPIVLPAGAAPEVRTLAATYNAMLDRLENERTATARAALRAHEDERARLGRDLHDEIGQNLTFLLLRLRDVGKAAPPELEAELEAVSDATRTTLEHVRSLSRQLRPGALADLGLKPALASLLDDARQLGLSTDLQFAGWVTPDAERDLAIYRVVQEALTNIIKHAQATSVTVSVERIDDMLAVTIADDGHGRAGIDGTGTGSMRERVRLVGGTFRRDASPGVGTTVAIEVPFAVSGGTESGPPTRPIPTISMFPPPAWGETDD